MEKLQLKNQGRIVQKEEIFAKKGKGDQAIENLGEILGKNKVNARSAFCFYPTVGLYPDALELRRKIQQDNGHNLLSAFCYEGTAGYVDRGIQGIEQEFMGWNSEYQGGVVLPTGTTAIQHATQIALTEYCQTLEHDYVNLGLPKDRKLVIIAPVHAHFLVERVAQACGLGSDACRYYNLDSRFTEDIDSLKQVIKNCREKGEEVFLNFMFGGGDTIRGLPQDINSVISAVGESTLEQVRRPFNLVDGAPHFFNSWANDTLDLQHPDIDAVLANPQKNGFPLGSTLFFLRDVRRLGNLNGQDLSKMSKEEFETERLNIQARGTWLISRDASSAIAFFATLEQKGNEWFREERLKAQSNADLFRSLLTSRPDLFNLIPSSNTISAFTINGNPSDTRKVAEAINLSREAFISYDPTTRVRSPEELELARNQFSKKQYSDYDGLWANFFMFQNKEDIRNFFSMLCDATEKVRDIK